MASFFKNKLLLLTALLILPNNNKYNSYNRDHIIITIKSKSLEIYSVLTDAINKAIERFDMKKTTLSHGNFNWYYKNNNDVFNLDTYNLINVRVQSSSNSKFLAEFSAANGYTNAYTQVLNTIYYKPETSKIQNLNKTLNTISKELISLYENRFGKITNLQISTSNLLTKESIETKLDYILKHKIAYDWSGKKSINRPPFSLTELQKNRDLKTFLTNAPKPANTIIKIAQNYFDLKAQMTKLFNANYNARWELNQLKENTQYPTETNGGIKTVNPNTGEISNYNVAYTVENSIKEFTNQLKVDQKEIKINILINHPKPVEVTIITSFQKKIDTISYALKDSISKIGLPYGDIVIEKGAIKTSYFGIAQANASPLPWDKETNIGWHSNKPIIEAIENEGTNNPGYHFSVKPPFNFGSFKDGGNFGYITNLLICDSVVSNITIKEKQKGMIYGSIFRTQTDLALNSKLENTIYTIEEYIYPKTQVPRMQQIAVIIGGSFVFLDQK